MDKVTVNEVGPRDGLQNIENILSVDERLRLIRSLEQAGIELIEIGSFVNDKAVPAMSNTDELINKLGNLDNYSVLIPNKKGLDKAKDNGVKEICTVLCVTDSMNKKNINQITSEVTKIFHDNCKSLNCLKPTLVLQKMMEYQVKKKKRKKNLQELKVMIRLECTLRRWEM